MVSDLEFRIFTYMVFETKKIEGETLSEYLTGVRESLPLTVGEVSARTGIKLKFLQSLESGHYKGLPPDVYVYGFLRQLARLYAVEPGVLIAQYKKEKGIFEHVRSAAVPESLWAAVRNRVVITPRSLTVVMASLFVLGTVLYIVWQVLSINQTPTLEIFQPKDRQILRQSSVEIVGKTDPGTVLTINSHPVFVDTNGNFKTQLSLSQGSQDLVFVAKNRFEKSVSKTVSVIGELTLAPRKESLVVELEFLGPVEIVYTIDSGSVQTMQFQSGSTTTLSAQHSIVVSTSDAGATKATVNSQPVGILGRSGERLNDIPFFAESDSIEGR